MTDGDVGQAASRLRLVYIIGTYPLFTTTFIEREIEVLRRLGVTVHVISIRRPPIGHFPPQKTNHSDVHYVLPVRMGALIRNHLEHMILRPQVYFRTLVRLLSLPHPALKTRVRTILHFGLGVHTSRLLREMYPCDHIHAHFVDRAALVALIAGRLLDKPFSATAHANDIYVDPVLLSEKIAQAKFVATCTRYNESHLRSMSNATSARKLKCIYHGLDVSKYHPQWRSRKPRPLLFAVGQLREKKGFSYLLEACRMLLDRGVEFDCSIVGEGPVRNALETKITELSLQHRVSLLGSLPHKLVIEGYSEATIFVLPCVTATDGDRDGIPNVILEAMAMGLPIVSTRHSGIPEAVEHGRTGLLVPPRDSAALADALAQLIADEELRERLGRYGRRRVVEAFDVEANVTKLLAEFIA
jgi:glycosyltransferase involved in cell wall biosynthesis